MRWTNPHAREVLGDAREARGQSRVPLWVAHAYAYADAYAYAYAPPARGIKMRNGLYAVTLSQSSSVAVLRVGWFRRSPEDPDEYEVLWVTPYRDGSKHYVQVVRGVSRHVVVGFQDSGVDRVLFFERSEVVTVERRQR